jgi:hypothetical protein
MGPVCFHQRCKIDTVNRGKGVSTRSDVARRRLLRPAARFENQPSQKYFDRNGESPTDMRGAYVLTSNALKFPTCWEHACRVTFNPAAAAAKIGLNIAYSFWLGFLPFQAL